MLKSKHVSENDLQELLSGDGESDKTLAIGEHLHQCATCRKALDLLAAQSEMWAKSPGNVEG